MHRSRSTAFCRFLSALFAFFLSVQLLFAADTCTYWQGPAGIALDWFNLSNWTNGIPSITCPYAFVENGGIALITSGTADAGYLYLADYNSGTVLQTGGELNANVHIGHYQGSSGMYVFQGGQLTAEDSIYVGGKGYGYFQQTGGEADIIGNGNFVVGQDTGGGTYELSGGTLSCVRLYLGSYGHIVQSGGTCTITDTLNLGSSSTTPGTDGVYELSGDSHLIAQSIDICRKPSQGILKQYGGSVEIQYLSACAGSQYLMQEGTLNLQLGYSKGLFDFGNGAASIYVASGGTFSFADSSILNSCQASITGGDNAFIVFPKGFDPTTDLANYSNPNGVTHIVGNVLHIKGWQDINIFDSISDHIICEGSLSLDNANVSEERKLTGGITVLNGGCVDVQTNIGIIQIDDKISGMSGGQLLTRAEKIGENASAQFTQSGGYHSVDGSLTISSNNDAKYTLTSGTLDVSTLHNHNIFEHTGGSADIDHLFVTEGGHYTISENAELAVTQQLRIGGDGTLTEARDGVVEQFGGEVSIAGALCLGTYYGATGTYILHGGTLNANWVSVGNSYDNASGYFYHDKGVHNVSNKLTLGTSGDQSGYYELGAEALLYAQNITVGEQGLGVFVQKCGEANVLGVLSLGHGTDSNGHYELQGGLLTSDSVTISRFGAASFLHTGGILTVNTTLLLGETTNGNGVYQLKDAGELTATTVCVQYTSEFQHSGGISNIKHFTGNDGKFTLTEGNINLWRRYDYEGVFDFAGSSAVFNIPSGIVEIADASFHNSSLGTINLGPEALLILPYDGYDMSQKFQGTYINSGYTHVQGNVLNIFEGRKLIGWGNLEGHINIAGSMDGYDGWLNVVGGLKMSETAEHVNLGTGSLSVNDLTSGMDVGTFAAREMTIGSTSTGTFVQNNGDVKIHEAMNVTQGQYEINAGTIHANDLQLSSTGQFNHKGGDVVVANKVKVNSGQYTLDGGTLSAPNVQTNRGSFIQYGGHQDISELLMIYSGDYQLHSGSIHANEIELITTTFQHSGGEVVTNSLGLTSGARYVLSGTGNLTINNDLYFADQESFTEFIQSGGKNHINGELVITKGRYELSDAGEVTSISTNLQNGTEFRHVDGSNIISDTLTIRSTRFSYLWDPEDPSRYTISGGRLEVGNFLLGGNLDWGYDREAGGLLSILNADAYIEVKNRMCIGMSGKIAAVPGAVIHMTGAHFENTSNKPGNMTGLASMTLLFEGGDQVIDTFEVGGIDWGKGTAGFDSNYALGTLQIGGESKIGQLQLVDLFDNSISWVGSEVLYVDNLILGSQSMLDLNGLNLYYTSFTDLGGTIVLNGGTLSQVPEPATLGMLAVGGLMFLRLRSEQVLRRKRK